MTKGRVDRAQARLVKAIKKERDMEAARAFAPIRQLKADVATIDRSVVAATLDQIDFGNARPFDFKCIDRHIRILQHDPLADRIYIPKIRTKSDIQERVSIGLFDDYRKALKVVVAVFKYLHDVGVEWLNENHPNWFLSLSYYPLPYKHSTALSNAMTGLVIADELGLQAVEHALRVAKEAYAGA